MDYALALMSNHIEWVRLGLSVLGSFLISWYFTKKYYLKERTPLTEAVELQVRKYDFLLGVVVAVVVVVVVAFVVISYTLLQYVEIQQETRAEATATTGSVLSRNSGAPSMTPTTHAPTILPTPTPTPLSMPTPTPTPTLSLTPVATLAATDTPDPILSPTSPSTVAHIGADLWVGIYQENSTEGSLRMEVYSYFDSTPNSLFVVVNAQKCHNPDFILGETWDELICEFAYEEIAPISDVWARHIQRGYLSCAQDATRSAESVTLFACEWE